MSSQNHMTNTNTARTSIRKLVKLKPPSNSIVVLLVFPAWDLLEFCIIVVLHFRVHHGVFAKTVPSPAVVDPVLAQVDAGLDRARCRLFDLLRMPPAPTPRTIRT